MGKHRALSKHFEQCCQKPSKGLEPVSKGRITRKYVCSCVQVLSHDVHFAIYDIVKSVPITVVDADYNSMMNDFVLVSFHKNNIFNVMTHYVHVTIITSCVLILCHQRKLYTDFNFSIHYIDVIMTTIASQITSLTVVYSTVYSGVDQRKHQSSASLAFVRGIHRGPVNSPHNGPVTRKMFPFDDVIMNLLSFNHSSARSMSILITWHGNIWWRHDMETSLPRRFPSQMSNNAEVWCFLWCQPEQAVDQTVRWSVIWDVIRCVVVDVRTADVSRDTLSNFIAIHKVRYIISWLRDVARYYDKRLPETVPHPPPEALPSRRVARLPDSATHSLPWYWSHLTGVINNQLWVPNSAP